MFQSHYSQKKSAALLGIGLKYVISVHCDDRGRMDPVCLENAVIQAQEKVGLLLSNPYKLLTHHA